MQTNAKPQGPGASRMRPLLRRLSSVGFPEKFVRQFVLPDWWDDEAAAVSSGLMHGLLLISRHLGADLGSLKDESAPVRLNLSGPCKFKKGADAQHDDLEAIRSLATQVAHLAAAAMPTEERAQFPSSAEEARRAILDEGHPWVGLGPLVAYCWSAGVPVIHLRNFPKGARRPDGMAARVRGHPVIILCGQRKSPAWNLFTLAHELGHVALGHVDEDGLLIDEAITENGDAETDAEEKAANAFALELLAGKAACSYRADGRWPNARGLAESAKALGHENQVDPGHIVLNYAHTMGGKDFWPVANAALRFIEQDGDALAVLRDHMAANLDWSALPKDSSVFLMRLTQAKGPAEGPQDEEDHSLAQDDAL